MRMYKYIGSDSNQHQDLVALTPGLTASRRILFHPVACNRPCSPIKQALAGQMRLCSISTAEKMLSSVVNNFLSIYFCYQNTRSRTPMQTRDGFSSCALLQSGYTSVDGLGCLSVTLGPHFVGC